MNSLGRLAVLAAALALGVAARGATKKNAADITRNQFFIISEVNQQKHQLILELPTQITRVMAVNADTSFTDSKGQREPITKIRAGDTVFVTYQQTSEGLLALSIRGGPMTVALLHQLYFKG